MTDAWLTTVVLSAGGGNRTQEPEGREALENIQVHASEVEGESPSFGTARDESQPVATARGTQPTDEELERAIVQAVTLGALDVARTLARRLDGRRSATLVHLDREREKRRSVGAPCCRGGPARRRGLGLREPG
jgi:hypothetical protein